MSTYSDLKAASPAAAQQLLEITGHIFAGQPSELASWRRRMGVSEAELTTTVRSFRDALGNGTRTAYPELY